MGAPPAVRPPQIRPPPSRAETGEIITNEKMRELRYTEALDEIKKLISKNPKLVSLYETQGEIFLAQKKYVMLFGK